MKKRNNKTIVLIVIGIFFVVLFGIFILNYSKDDASFSILEKKWISDNTSNIIDVSVYNDDPVYGNKGKGVIYDLLNDFKTLVNYQIEKYPEQEKYMKEHMNYIINNLDGIKNQNDEDYKVHCSMEGHVNQAFARYITSSPYGFSKQGLENKLKLLVYRANKHELTIEDYYNLKYENNNYEEINIKIKKLCNIKYDQRLSSNHSLEYKINTSLPILDSPSENNRLKELTSIRQEIYVI